MAEFLAAPGSPSSAEGRCWAPSTRGAAAPDGWSRDAPGGAFEAPQVTHSILILVPIEIHGSALISLCYCMLEIYEFSIFHIGAEEFMSEPRKWPENFTNMSAKKHHPGKHTSQHWQARLCRESKGNAGPGPATNGNPRTWTSSSNDDYSV